MGIEKDTCPFSRDLLERLEEEDYVVGGSRTANRLISFGKGLETGCTTSTVADKGKETIDVIRFSCSFSSSVISRRNPTLKRNGVATVSDIWVIIPRNVVELKLYQKIHQGGIDKIFVYDLELIDKAEKDQGRVTKTYEFTSCFITDLIESYKNIAVFSFACAKVKIAQQDIDVYSADGKNPNAAAGSFVYEFDYNNGHGGVSTAS